MSEQPEERVGADGYPEDDPEAGIFWGPPDSVTGECHRWSRVWFEWRDREPPLSPEPIQ